MESDFRLLPEKASEMAGDVDALYLFLVVSTLVVSAVIGGLILVFLIRYRRSAGREVGQQHAGTWIELGWALIPFVFGLVVFVWAARLYFTQQRPPKGGIEVFVVAKQWMWQFQHATGQREIDELHVPRGIPVVLTMISEDVIHSFFVPSFRAKQDVLPGRFVKTWFEPTETGQFHLFCAEYCGTGHSHMTGRIIVMEPTAYQAWLDANPAPAPAAQGELLFGSLGCSDCHGPKDGRAGPSLAGLHGRTVRLADGYAVVADDNYIRESILEPEARLVAGWAAVMPSYAGRVAEDDMVQLLAYVRSLGEAEP